MDEQIKEEIPKPDIQFVQEFFDLKEESKSIDKRLCIGCDNLLKQIYFKYRENDLNESEFQLIKYIPHYTTNVKFMGLFFSVDFNLVEQVNSDENSNLDLNLANDYKEKSKKIDKKIYGIIESDNVKQMFPQMYMQVKNKFLNQVSKLDELVERSKLSEKFSMLKNKIKSSCKTRNEWSTMLYQWYWNNKLNNCDLPKKYNDYDFNVLTPPHFLNSIYLFADLEIKFISGTKKQNKLFGNKRFTFENNYYTIEFDYCKLYPNGYAPKYEIEIISKLSGNINNWQEFSSPLKMCAYAIYESVITFILSHCDFYYMEIE